MITSVANLPDQFLSLPTLELLSASVNCLSPQLPLSLCNSSNTFSELYLNGLQQSSLCKSKNQGLTSLPSCIWSLTSLAKLYLSGNGYTGKLSYFSLSNTTEQDVSSNRLYGTLPVVLNHRSMHYFDVSSNHFSGTLWGFFIQPLSSQNSTYKANVNRLSCPIPPNTLESFSNINVLSGNVISCTTVLPIDPNSSFL